MKKYILGLITGLIIAGIIGVSATILYQAEEVGFTPDDPNWNVNNLEDALNDLYANKGSVDNYDNKTYTQEGLSIYSNRVSILDGGYYVDENDVTWVNMTIKANIALTSNTNWLLIYGLPAAETSFNITSVDRKYGFRIGMSYDGSKNGCITYYDYMKITIPKDTEFTLQFKYQNE